MLFAIRRDMANHSIVDVINCIDCERDILPRDHFLELEFADANWKHNVHDVSFGIYDKYFDNQMFLDRVWPI